MTDTPPTPPRPSNRAESREISELRLLKDRQPELATAADLQIALLELQRRVQSRVPMPWVEVDPAWWKRQQAEGHHLLRYEDIPISWTDFRLLFRETAAILHRFEALETTDFDAIHTLSRDGNALETLVKRWFVVTTAGTRPAAEETADAGTIPDMVLQVLMLSARPFLARCAEVLMPTLDVSEWSKSTCPLCGGEPDLAVITQSADRLLICGRCTARWRFAAFACPFCANTEKDRITSFASRDGTYRIYACEMCLRYIKAYDARRSTRPVLPALDSVATLPLDAAAMQRGYTG